MSDHFQLNGNEVVHKEKTPIDELKGVEQYYEGVHASIVRKYNELVENRCKFETKEDVYNAYVQTLQELENLIATGNDKLKKCINEIISLAMNISREHNKLQEGSIQLFLQLRDIAEMKKQAEILLEHRKLLTAQAAHDLRAPFTVIMFVLGEILDSSTSEEVKMDLAKDALRVGNEALVMIENFIAYSIVKSIDRKDIKINWKKVNLVELISESIHLKKVLFNHKGVDCTFNVSKNFPEVVVTDPDRINHIFLNLITNALKYTPQYGNIDVSLDYDDSEDEFIMRVADTGPGMSPETMLNLFKPFTKGVDDVAIKSNLGFSTGLGLSIVKLHVELLGGTSLPQSKLGEGTTFTIILPAKLKEVAEQEA